MNKETKEVLLNCIKHGGYVPGMLIDVSRLLANAGMELYAKPCCRRIEEAGLVDGIHIANMAPPSWKLELSTRGFEICRDILAAYLPPDYMDSVSKMIQECHEYNISANNVLYSLRKMSDEDLKENRRDGFIYRIEDRDVKDVEDLFRAEIKRRRFCGRVRYTAGRVVLTCQLLLKFTGPVCILFPFIKKAWESWDTFGSEPIGERNGKYARALRRFTDAHGGTSKINKLSGEDLIKFVYLAVKTYGKENQTEINHVKRRSCIEIESRYRELKEVMDVIGRLTPKELLRMYPVEKTFDGEKWGEKDYYYTMRKLGCWPENQPVGDARDVACLLWDYQNRDLEFLLLQWMNVLGCLRSYCNNPGPDDEFHNKLLRREKDDE